MLFLLFSLAVASSFVVVLTGFAPVEALSAVPVLTGLAGLFFLPVGIAGLIAGAGAASRSIRSVRLARIDHLTQPCQMSDAQVARLARLARLLGNLQARWIGWIVSLSRAVVSLCCQIRTCHGTSIQMGMVLAAGRDAPRIGAGRATVAAYAAVGALVATGSSVACQGWTDARGRRNAAVRAVHTIAPMVRAGTIPAHYGRIVDAVAPAMLP